MGGTRNPTRGCDPELKHGRAPAIHHSLGLNLAGVAGVAGVASRRKRRRGDDPQRRRPQNPAANITAEHPPRPHPMWPPTPDTYTYTYTWRGDRTDAFR